MPNKIFNSRLETGFIRFSEDRIAFEAFFHDNSPISVLILPPNPNEGGTMYENLIDKIFRECDANKISVMRITFVKHNIVDNTYDKYIRQGSVAIDEIKDRINKTTFVFIGYSFGALIALSLLLRRPEASLAFLISPPIIDYDFVTWIHSFKTKVSIIYGSQDSLCPSQAIEMYTDFLIKKDMEVTKDCIMGVGHKLEKKESNVAKFIVNKILK